MSILQEDNRNQLISKSRSGKDYAPTNQHRGRNRYERRLYSSVSNKVDGYNHMDMNRLFDDDLLDVNIEVHGETDDYMVKIKMSGVMENMQSILRNKQ